jgi:hypothetical protein
MRSLLKARILMALAAAAMLTLDGVAASAQSSRPSPLMSFSAIGQGTATPTPSSNCFVSNPCTVTIQSSLRGTFIGTGSISGSLNVDISKATGNASSGDCWPASGTGNITPAGISKTSTIAVEIVGALCEVASSGSALTFNGIYLFDGGTGKFATSQGVGNFVGSIDSDDGLLLSAVGSFRQHQ